MAGVKGRSGRKTFAEELGLKHLLDECWTNAQRRQVVATLHAKATDKEDKACVPAATLLLAYAYGKPTERVEHTSPDGSVGVVAVNHYRKLREDFSEFIDQGLITEDQLKQLTCEDTGANPEELVM